MEDEFISPLIYSNALKDTYQHSFSFWCAAVQCTPIYHFSIISQCFEISEIPDSSGFKFKMTQLDAVIFSDVRQDIASMAMAIPAPDVKVDKVPFDLFNTLYFSGKKNVWPCQTTLN